MKERERDSLFQSNPVLSVSNSFSFFINLSIILSLSLSLFLSLCLSLSIHQSVSISLLVYVPPHTHTHTKGFTNGFITLSRQTNVKIVWINFVPLIFDKFINIHYPYR